MKKKMLAGLATGLFMFVMANMVSAEIYGGIDFPNRAVSFVDEWVSYEPTTNVLPPYNDPSTALGIPDYSPGFNRVSLGDEGVLILKFTDNSLTTSGDDSYDLCIFEIGDQIESTSVTISTDGSGWIDVGNAAGGTSCIDIDAFISSGVVLGERYSFVMLTDLLPHQSGSPYEGADIDAVGAISSAPPVPTITCRGDFDLDGDVDGSDLAIFAADFGRTNCEAEIIGTWIGDEDNGQADSWGFFFSCDHLDVVGPQEWCRGTFLLNKATTPYQADFFITASHDEVNIGKTSLGIYQVEGDTLTIAFNEPGVTERPSSFSSNGTRVFLLNK